MSFFRIIKNSELPSIYTLWTKLSKILTRERFLISWFEVHKAQSLVCRVMEAKVARRHVARKGLMRPVDDRSKITISGEQGPYVSLFDNFLTVINDASQTFLFFLLIFFFATKVAAFQLIRKVYVLEVFAESSREMSRCVLCSFTLVPMPL